MLVRIDLDLEMQSDRWHILGPEAVAECYPTLRLLPPRLTEPGIQNLPQTVTVQVPEQWDMITSYTI